MDQSDRKELGFERFIFFSDAIVAIAITLLALELRLNVPDGHHVTFRDLAEPWQKYLAFVLSFINIAGFLIALLLLVTLFLRRSSAGRVSVIVECICIAVIALTTGVGHWVIAMRMRALRAAMVLPIDQIAIDDARRIEFNSLHGYSVNALGLAMIAALVALVLMARSLRN